VDADRLFETEIPETCQSLFIYAKIQILYLKQFRTAPNFHILLLLSVLFPAKAMSNFLVFNASQTCTSKPKYQLTEKHYVTTKFLTSRLLFRYY